MAACNTEEQLFLTQELYNKIVETHSDLQIEGLTFAEQREIVSFISNKMYKEAQVPDQKYTLADVKVYILKTISDIVDKNSSSIAGLTATTESAEEFKDTVLQK